MRVLLRKLDTRPRKRARTFLEPDDTSPKRPREADGQTRFPDTAQPCEFLGGRTFKLGGFLCHDGLLLQGRSSGYQLRIGEETTSRGFKNVTDLREKSKRPADNPVLVGALIDDTK